MAHLLTEKFAQARLDSIKTLLNSEEADFRKQRRRKKKRKRRRRSGGPEQLEPIVAPGAGPVWRCSAVAIAVVPLNEFAAVIATISSAIAIPRHLAFAHRGRMAPLEVGRDLALKLVEVVRARLTRR